MIKTIKGANGSFAQMGNPQVQPPTDDLAYAAKKGSTTASSQTSTGTPPAHETGLSTPVINHNEDDFDVTTGASLSDIANSLSTDPDFLLPPYHSTQNSIMPSYATQLEPTSVKSNASVLLTDYLSTKTFEPYEQLTGISHERPEIVMLTNFLPLFTKDVSHSQPSFSSLLENGGIYPFMTDAGHFVDTHVNARAMRQVNMTRFLRELSTVFSYLFKTYSTRKTAFENQMQALKVTTNFLLGLVRSLEHIKGQLDLRDDLHTVDPHRVAQIHLSNFTAIPIDVTHSIFDLIKLYLPPSYTIPDTLVRLGYKRENINHRYASTKIWLQLMHELKQIIRFHSLEFLDIDPVTARNDDKAARLSRTNASLFGLRQQLPGLPSVHDITKSPAASIPITHSILTTAWSTIYRDVHFKSTEAHIAALVNFVSKEFRCSYGLGKNDVQNALRNHYDYAVTQNSNSQVFESIIGPIGNSITDFPLTAGRSLAAVAQRTPASDLAVMTFESKFIDGDTGTLTPGSQHFIDRVLKTDGKTFDTVPLDELGNLLEHSHTRFSTIVEGMNLLATHVVDPLDVLHTQYSSLLSNPADFVRGFAKNLLHFTSGETLSTAKSDNLGAIYSYAATHPYIRTTLFIFTLARINRLYPSAFLPAVELLIDLGLDSDNTPLTDKLIEDVISELQSTVPTAQHTSTGSGENATMTRETIRTAMKAGTKLTHLIETTMLQVLRSFKHNNDAMINANTRFNGYQDTIMMMMVFDALLMMVSKYCNQHIVSQTTAATVDAGTVIGAIFGFPGLTGSTVTFSISRTSTTHHASIHELLTRLEKETSLTQKIVYATLNTLQRLSGACKNYSNYLKSPTSTGKLKELAGILNNNQLLQMLISEQQIMMLAATVHDLTDKIAQPGSVTLGSDAGDADSDGDFDSDDEFKLLDDAVVLPRLRNALYGLFGTREYAQQKGFNKRIISVGIPAGFTQRLKQRVKIGHLKKSSFVNKQNDIVQIVIYRVDMENSDIIYKPQRFLFELSRFPVRNDRRFLAIPENPTIDDIVHAIPTRDFNQSEDQKSDVTYWALRTDDVSRGQRVAFADESYSFLSHHQKAEIARNHVLSYLMEVYVRLITGLSIADYHFDMVPTPKPVDMAFTKLLIDHHVAFVAKSAATNQVSNPEDHPPAGGVLFSSTASPHAGFVASKTSTTSEGQGQPQQNNASGITGDTDPHVQFQTISTDPQTRTIAQQKSIGTTSSNLSKISHRSTATALHGLRTISNMSHTVSPMSDPLAVSKKILTPKQFDRVLNVPVDPDDFEIDYAKTVKTPHGKQALHQMIQKGDIILQSENDTAAKHLRVGDFTVPTGMRVFTQNRAAANVHRYKRRTRDKNEGDLTLDKYFVTVETFGEDEV